MLKKTCNYMNKNDLVFNNYIYDSCISPCCYDYKRKINLNILNNAEETYKSICSMINFKQNLTENELKQKYPGCYYCEFRNQEYNQKIEKISFVNLSMYPSPCQCNCIYCDIRKNNKFMTLTIKDFAQYKIIFEALDKLILHGYISNDSIWQVSCGEITIHPFRKFIYDYTKDKNVKYFTNCFVYDKELSEILHQNKKAKLNFSIDSGNAITWNKIKGVNNFNIIIKNLYNYIENSSSNQIELKYILLSGINDDEQNFVDIIRIMKEMKINKLIIEHNYDDEITEKLVNSKKYFEFLLKKNDIIYDSSF